MTSDEFLPDGVPEDIPTAKLVYLYLNHVDDPQTTGDIATALDASRRAVQYALSELDANGLVESVSHYPNPHHCRYRLK